MNLTISKKRVAYIQESFCISIAISIGIVIYLAFQLEHGYWIPMTTSIMFLATNQGQGAFIRKTRDRVLGTLTGALLGFLYINILMYANYHWGYMMIFVWFIGFYVYYVTGNYALLAVMITMYVPMLLAAFSTEPLGIGTTLFKRITCTIIGVSIAIIAEYVIYRKAASAAPIMKQNTADFFLSLGEFIKMTTDHFMDTGTKAGFVNDDYRKNVWSLICSMSSIENIYLSIRDEFEYKEQQEQFYQYFLKNIPKLSRTSRKMTGIMGHDKYDASISDFKELKQISHKVAQKYKNILQYIGGKTDNCTEVLDLILKKVDIEEKYSPTYLFIRSLYVFSLLADELAYAMYHKNFEYKDFHITDSRYLANNDYK